MREYELYLPLHYNDGQPIEGEKLAEVKQQLAAEFGGLTYFPQENEGLWKVGAFTFRDRIVILRIISTDLLKAAAFFAKLKEHIKKEWQQTDVLIVSRDVDAL